MSDTDFYDHLVELVRQDDQRVGVPSSDLPDKAPKPIEDMLTVAWAVTRNPLQGGEYYRATRPAALANRGYGWHTGVIENIGSVEGSKKVAGQAYGSQHVMEPDVWIMRPIGKGEGNWTLAGMVEKMHAAGQKVIVDLDDDVWSHEDWTEDTRPTGEQDDHFEDWCWDTDAWLVSTEWMKVRVEQMAARRGRPQPKVVYAPNCYDPFGIGVESHPVPGRRLGTRLWLSGRMSGDLEIYRTCFAPLLTELDLQFVHIGREAHIGHTIEEGPGVHARSFSSHCGMPSNRLIELDSCTIPEMGRLLGTLINIAAIAIADHPFNYAKTETQAVECASAGLPLVAATTLPLYEKVPGRVDPTPEAVGRRVEHLLDTGAWRYESDKARSWARKVSVSAEAIHMRALQALVYELCDR